MSMLPNTAQGILARCGITTGEDFHRLGSSAVECLLAAAKEWRYRTPKNAPGSRARMFHGYLQRAASRR